MPLRMRTVVKPEMRLQKQFVWKAKKVNNCEAENASANRILSTSFVQIHSLGDTTQMVIEFCDGGALLDRLRDTQKPALLVTKLLEYAKQIASGMAYLELDSKRCVHRDLAARNVLLTNNEEVSRDGVAEREQHSSEEEEQS